MRAQDSSRAAASGPSTTAPAPLPVPQPDWDMSPYFDALCSESYQTFWRALDRDRQALQRELERARPIAAGSLDEWADLLGRLEDLATRTGHVSGYLACRGAADSRNEEIVREAARSAAAGAKLDQCQLRAEAALGQADGATFEALAARPELEDAGDHLRRLRERARRRMAPDLERLASELEVTGLGAWGRLYDQLSGDLQMDLEVPGRPPERVPVALTRSLLESPDAAVRQAAHAGSTAAWRRVAPVAGACLNAIAGTRLLLYDRRGIDHFLDPALVDARIERKTLDTLLCVVRERAEVARRYLRHKARLLGRERIGFQDLTAPLPPRADASSADPIPWSEACRRVVDAFDATYPELARFAESAIERRWIDHTPRPGKRPGGFCSSSRLIRESRVFMTYNGTLGDLSTLAHELGHAYHSHVLREHRPWACLYPMTLAETASTFAEQLVIDSVLDDPAAQAEERATLLDSRMQDAALFLLHIPMRLAFEQRLYQERQDGEVAVSRLGALMAEAQREIYGDVLDPDGLDPMLWASKLHFYITWTSFYSFPYTFGYLLSLGIGSLARREGPAFLPRYVEMLQLTGRGSAESVVRRSLDIDLGQPAFWHAAIDSIEADLERFETELLPLYAS